MVGVEIAKFFGEFTRLCELEGEIAYDEAFFKEAYETAGIEFSLEKDFDDIADKIDPPLSLIELHSSVSDLQEHAPELYKLALTTYLLIWRQFSINFVQDAQS